MGGQGDAQDVVKEVEARMKEQLREGDYEVNTDGSAKWEKGVHFQRLAMVHEGLLERHSPRGVWAITDQGRSWLS